MKCINLSMASGHFFYSQSEIREGENLASRLNIILSDDFLGYTYNLLFRLNDKPPVLTEPLTSDEDNSINYILTKAVTSEAGILQVELQASDHATGLLAKSAIIRLKVIESIDGSGEVMPEEYVPWVTVINTAATTASTKATEASGYATTASTKATEASGYATTASTKATEASGYAATASTKATEASGYAATASTKATEASGYAATAGTKAGEASGYATTATQQAGLASTKATEASGYAATAGEKAVEAAASAVTAVNATAGKANAAEVYTKTEVDNKDALKADKLMATNLVTNGDFVSDLSGWGSYLQKATWVDGRAYFNRPVGGGLVTLQKNNLPISSGDKIYVRMDVDTVKSKSSNYGVLNNGGAPPYIFNFNNMPVGQKTLTGVFDITSWGNLYFNISEGAEYYIDKVSIINLTATFGAGNEPTKEQMDALLAKYPNSWFDGTVDLVSVNDLMNQKASKAQEAWITPTLLNGWTQIPGQEAAYMKDTLGFVHFKGTVTTGTLSVAIFNLPAGYGPAQPRSFPTSANGLFGQINVNANGSVVFVAGSATNVYLDGVTYKGEQ